MNILLLPILLPLAAGIIALVIPRKLKEAWVLTVTVVNMALAIFLYAKRLAFTLPWAGSGIELSLRLYHFSAFIMLATAFFGLLVALYATASLRDKGYAKQFFAYLLLTIGLANGAVLADNLVAMLFFLEGLLVTTFGMIAIGRKEAFKAATKAFIIIGVGDLCMMVGIALCGHIGGTLTISKLSIATSGLGGLAFILMMIGALGKSGSMPLHTWIPDAATEAPLPFMAMLPGAMEKLVGIYLLTRISLDIFRLSPHSWASMTLMIIGAVTIVGAVMMALIQKDYKRLLSYHAISQLGYMILGIGTLVPAGIVGGLFHMINNALYKSCLFLTGGSVEKQAGTTNLEELGGLGKMMPVTFGCFIITALAISGVPPFNGFFSKELVYDGALERGRIFYIAAVLGSFLTAASFLKLGHAAFLGRPNREGVREAPLAMLVPMIIIAALCIVFGVWNALPLKLFIQPILGERLAGHDYSGMHVNIMLTTITIIVLLGALANHLYGAKKTGSGLKAADHIHYAPFLHPLYDKAEKGKLDPYNIGMGFTSMFAAAASWCDGAINWVYDDLAPGATGAISAAIRKLHDGSYRTYILWSVAALAIVVIVMLNGLR